MKKGIWGMDDSWYFYRGLKRVNVRIHDYSLGVIEECPDDPFQNDELNVLFIGNNH